MGEAESREESRRMDCAIVIQWPAGSCLPDAPGRIPRARESGVDLISDTLPFGRLWHDGPQADQNTIDYSKFTAVHMMP